MSGLNWGGAAVGAAAFVIIGAFHPIVIKCEYYLGARAWPLFAVPGVVVCTASLFCENPTVSAILSVLGFTMLWSVRELKQQEKRVQRGWFGEEPEETGNKMKVQIAMRC